MAHLFKTAVLSLGKQIITASGNNLYVNGQEVTAIISGNLILTGVDLINKINSLSGYVDSEDALVSGYANLLYGNNIVYRTGNQSVSGTKTFQNGIRISGYNDANKYISFANSIGNFGSGFIGYGVFDSFTNDLIINNSSDGGISYNVYSNGSHRFYVRASRVATITSAGQFALGTVSPSAFLHSTGAIRSDSSYFSGSVNLADIFYPRTNPSGYAPSTSLTNVVYLTGTQTITGQKSFLRPVDIYNGTTSSIWTGAAIFYGSANADDAGVYIDIKQTNSLLGYGGRIYGGRWSSSNRGLRIRSTNSVGAEGPFLHLNAETANIHLVGGPVSTSSNLIVSGAYFSGSTNLADIFSTKQELVNTGLKITSLSGWTDSNFVHRTGQELISGRKIFTFSPVLTGIEFLGLSGSGLFLSAKTDGSIAFNGSGGEILTLEDNTTGALFSVVNEYDSPIFEVYSDGKVTAGDFLSNTFLVSGNSVTFGALDIQTGYRVFISGNTKYIGDIYSGNINIVDLYYPRSNPSGFITGLAGTGSLATLSQLNSLSGYVNSEIDLISGFATGLYSTNIVYTTGNQNITGAKTFHSQIRVSGYNNVNNGAITFANSSGTFGSNSIYYGGIIGSNDLYINNGSDGSVVYNSYSNGSHAFRIATVDRMRITSQGRVGIGTTTPSYDLEVTGSFAAATKSFVIPHPIISGKRLQHGVIEGPEHAIFIRGHLIGSGIIQLPNYWEKLIDEKSITVNLTPIGEYQKLYVKNISNKEIEVKNSKLFFNKINCFYEVKAERKDVPKLEVEI